MSSTERYDYDIKKSVALYKTAMKLTEDEGSLDGFRNMLGAAIGSAITPDGNPIGLHFIMFIPTLMGQVYRNAVTYNFDQSPQPLSKI